MCTPYRLSDSVLVDGGGGSGGSGVGEGGETGSHYTILAGQELAM